MNSNHQRLSLLLQRCNSVHQLRQLHAHLLTSGHLSGHAAALILRYSALRGLPSALPLLSPLPFPSWNQLLRSFALSDSPSPALLLFLILRRSGHRPDHLTFPFLLKSCSHLRLPRFGAQAHADALKLGVLPVDVYVNNALANLYGVCLMIDDARKVFDEMPLRTLVSWNTLLTALCHCEREDEAVGVVGRMKELGIRPNEATFVVLLSAAAKIGSLSFGKWLHGQIVLDGELEVSVRLGTAVVNMYAKCGAIAYACRVFDEMPVRNVWTWSAMILGYTHHGSAEQAFRVYEAMKKSDSVKPNYVTFLALLSACSHGGLVKEAYGFFEEMVKVHRVKPMLMHYSAMVDVLGRKGLLQEAYDFIKGMPVEPDAVVWRTLLSACQMHSSKDVDGIGENVQRVLLALEPKRSGNYVIAANFFLESGASDEAAKVRRIMREEGLKKAPGESTIDVAGKTHRFISGDNELLFVCSYSSMRQVLHGLVLNMKLMDSLSFDIINDVEFL